jgi:uncharacterized SAM-binding protein YcdF (DUF218 family)
MKTAADLIKYALVPGSIGFLMAGVTIGIVLLYGSPSVARWGRRSMLALVTLYWMLSLPPVTVGLEASLSRLYEKTDVAPQATVLVVLGAGSITCRGAGGEISLPTPQSAFNVLEAARVYRLMANPDVIASGGAPDPYLQLRPEAEVLRQELIRAGVPASKITIESNSLDTHDQAVEIARMLRRRHVTRLALVASTTHLPRAVALFRAQGLDPIAVGAPLRSDSDGGWDRHVLPSLKALRASEMVSYHYLATAYAWLRGWLDPVRER